MVFNSTKTETTAIHCVTIIYILSKTHLTDASSLKLPGRLKRIQRSFQPHNLAPS